MGGSSFEMITRGSYPNAHPDSFTYRQEIPLATVNLTVVTSIPTWMDRLTAGMRLRRDSNRLLRVGNRLYQKGSFTEAAEVYRQGVDIDPNRLVMRFNLGLALYKSGQKAAGRAEWQTVRDRAQYGNAYLFEQAEIMLRQFG